MKFNININQKAIIDNKLGLDVVDASIIDFLHVFSLSTEIIKVPFENDIYFYFSHKKIVDDMPILALKKDSVYRRLKKICDLGLMKQHPNSKELRMTLYAFTSRVQLLFFSDNGYKSDTTDENPIPIGDLSDTSSDKSPMNYNIIDNNINNRDKGALEFLKENSFSLYENFEMRFKKQISDFSKFCELFDLKFDEENLEYTVKKINSRLTRFAINYCENERKGQGGNQQQVMQPTTQQYQKTRF
ncbi:hypothetical protein [Myroides odoratimimus]|uniref:hypothetical protein n=1 Tax=Myroides odoratimimus TaxID=76832 RepID=UPI00257609D6|nr:hypothetical protein [Myroides odoratimimus]MDM1535070.1 hypothetical protein [Myroides odoratimimus]MDM1674172.1 hypothetical protein [Myroides odoratimimus]